MNNLIYGVATAAGRMISLATVASRHVWLGLTALSKKDREDRLFGSFSSLVEYHVHVWHDLVEKTESLVFKHPHKAPSLSDSYRIKVHRVLPD
ncbi:hypothetical protein JOQ06_028636, partial [Pogonophryne albipinna]